MASRVAAFGAESASSRLAPMSIDRRDAGARDVVIDVTHCGVCHSDLHTARGEWPGITFPVVPGHEIIGTVSAVGAEVKGFRAGMAAAVGCLVDSCRRCSSCAHGVEQYCTNGPIFTYNSPDAHFPGRMTYGGYSKRIVVDERYVLRVPEGLDRAGAAPLLCAGITTYSPLRHWGAGPGRTVGIVGLGGLGHMGVKLSNALGAHTVLFTTSPGKAEDAKRLGADEVVVSREAAQMAKQAGRFDFILDTVSAPHDLDALTTCLRRDGTLCLVGAPSTPHPSPSVWPLLMKRASISGSAIGGIAETQEMLDFCGRRGIVSDVEVIAMQAINEAYERMLRSDVKYRFVIDMSTLR